MSTWTLFENEAEKIMTYIFYTTLFRASSLEAISLEAFVFLPFTEHFEAEKF